MDTYLLVAAVLFALLLVGVFLLGVYYYLLGLRLQENRANQRESITLVSHNLLTPLGRIRYAAEALLGEIAGLPEREQQRAKELVQQVLSDTEGLVRGTTLLLEYSDLLSKEGAANFGVTDTSQVVESAVDHYRPLMLEKDLQFVIELPKEKLPRVSMNELYLRAILEVLLDNALRYTPMGGRVRFAVEQEKGQLQFSVEDTGKGLREEQLSSLFSRSWDLRTESGVKDSGMGLGLIVAKRIIERHRGTITARSAGEGRGSEFSFTLPLRH